MAAVRMVSWNPSPKWFMNVNPTTTSTASHSEWQKMTSRCLASIPMTLLVRKRLQRIRFACVHRALGMFCALPNWINRASWILPTLPCIRGAWTCLIVTITCIHWGVSLLASSTILLPRTLLRSHWIAKFTLTWQLYRQVTSIEMLSMPLQPRRLILLWVRPGLATSMFTSTWGTWSTCPMRIRASGLPLTQMSWPE
jgi:hypothetical protein